MDILNSLNKSALQSRGPSKWTRLSLKAAGLLLVQMLMQLCNVGSIVFKLKIDTSATFEKLWRCRALLMLTMFIS
jgi:hypothetical protein